jgi:hypothetical protein
VPIGFAPRLQLTSARQSETLRSATGFKVGVMTGIRMAALSVAFAGAFLVPTTGASAQAAPQGLRTAQPAATEISAQRRVRPPTRLRVTPYSYYGPGPDGVYPSYYPGRNAVRVCNATYVQEFRPSGTVIVPHMSCVWRGG